MTSPTTRGRGVLPARQVPVQSVRPLRALRRAAVGCCVVALPVGLPVVPDVAAQTATVIRNARVIDGTGRPPMPAADIVIQGRRIVGLSATGSVQIPPDARVIDASGKTVIPGIINLRGLAGLVRSPERAVAPFSRTEIARQLGIYASYGVTTTTTLSPLESDLRGIRSSVEAGQTPPAARTLTPLRILTSPQGRTHENTLVERLFHSVQSPAGARRAVDLLAREGADYIEFREGRRGPAETRDPLVPRAIISQAERHGLRIVVHARELQSAAALVRDGANVLAASVSDRLVPDKFIEDLLVRDIVYAPALSAESIRFEFGDRPAWLDDRYLRRSLQPGITGLLKGPVSLRQALDPDRALKMLRFDTALQNLRRLAEAGVRIGLASGSGFPGTFEGFSEYREAVLMNRAGMTAADVIRAFSEGSATALGVSDERGMLRPGHTADLVILNANPLDNIHNLRELHAVFVHGRLARL